MLLDNTSKMYCRSIADVEKNSALFVLGLSINYLRITDMLRNSRLQMFFKIGVPKNFKIFHWRTPVFVSLFNKVAVLNVLTLFKTAFYIEHLWWLFYILFAIPHFHLCFIWPYRIYCVLVILWFSRLFLEIQIDSLLKNV